MSDGWTAVVGSRFDWVRRLIGVLMEWWTSLSAQLMERVKGLLETFGFQPDMTYKVCLDWLGYLNMWVPVGFLVKALLSYMLFAGLMGRVRWFLRMLGRNV